MNRATLAKPLGNWSLWLAALSILALVLAAPGVGGLAAQQNKGQVQDMNSLPKEVRQALDRASKVYQHPLSGANWTDFATFQATDHPLYQLQGTNERGNRIEIEITSAGRILEVEEHGIALSEVPGAVTTALKTKMPKFDPEKVEAIYQMEQTRPVCYGFEGRDADGNKLEIYISADGRTFLN